MSESEVQFRATREVNLRRCVALRGLFLRLADDLLHRGPGAGPWDPPRDAQGVLERETELARNPLPEAVLALPLPALRAAVLRLLQPTGEEQTEQLAQDSGVAEAPQSPSSEVSEAGPSASVAQPLSALSAKELLVILGGEKVAKRGGRVELVESLEPLRSVVWEPGFHPNFVRKGSVAVGSARVPSAVLLLGSIHDSHTLRATFRVGCSSPTKAEGLDGLGWDSRFGAAATAVGGRVFVCGGYKAGQLTGDVLALDEEGQARHLRGLQDPRTFHSLLTFRGCLVALGGLSKQKLPMSGVEGLCLRRTGSEWQRFPELPLPLFSFGAAVHRGRLFVAGGRTERGADSAAVFSLAGLGLGWVKEGGLAQARSGLSLVVFGGRLYALGGGSVPKGHDGDSRSSVEVYDDERRGWRLLEGNLRLPVDGSFAFVVR